MYMSLGALYKYAITGGRMQSRDFYDIQDSEGNLLHDMWQRVLPGEKIYIDGGIYILTPEGEIQHTDLISLDMFYRKIRKILPYAVLDKIQRADQSSWERIPSPNALIFQGDMVSTKSGFVFQCVTEDGNLLPSFVNAKFRKAVEYLMKNPDLIRKIKAMHCPTDEGPLRIYFAHPMTDVCDEDIFEEEDKLETICRMMEDILQIKVDVINHYDPEKDDRDPLDTIGDGLHILKTADLVVFSHNWTSSKGCRLEREACSIYDIPRVFLESDSISGYSFAEGGV